MRTSVALVTALFALAGCTAHAPEPAPAPPAGIGAPVETPQQDVIAMNDIDLYMHDSSPTPGITSKPTFWVHARHFTQLEGEKTLWQLEGARAVIYDKKSGEEAIVVEAGSGRFEEDKGAKLNGGVVARAGTMEIKLQDMEWRNPAGDEPGLAWCDGPVSVKDPKIELEAAGIRLYPEDKRYELTQVRGTVRFGSDPS